MDGVKLPLITFLLFISILLFSSKTYLYAKEEININHNIIAKEIEIVNNKIDNLNKDYEEILSQISSLEESEDIESLQNQINELNSLIKELQKENEELKKELR